MFLSATTCAAFGREGNLELDTWFDVYEGVTPEASVLMIADALEYKVVAKTVRLNTSLDNWIDNHYKFEAKAQPRAITSAAPHHERRRADSLEVYGRLSSGGNCLTQDFIEQRYGRPLRPSFSRTPVHDGIDSRTFREYEVAARGENSVYWRKTLQFEFAQDSCLAGVTLFLQKP